ncbi:MAG TPA: serine hydrolase domain-containing protein [Pyrinomonadaceae bacterium]|nr:serine hydrolase domain-containing protein [Pyrinomonadaceae bacterium]
MKRIFLIFFTLFIQVPAASQSADVEALLRREMHERRIAGLQVAVVQNHRIVLLKSFGIADIHHSVPTTNKTIFPIYSCTKAFTGVAIMQLVEEGKIDLNAPVSRYLDGLPESWQAITIRQLLTHVSGLPNVLSVLDPVNYGFPHGMNEEQVWTKLKSMPVSSAPGERFSYNQTNYALLGKIIDKFGARPFAETFKQRQFQPAGMQSTGFGDSRDVIKNAASTYRYVNSVDGRKLASEKLIKDYAQFPEFRWTASGMNSTAEDLAHWLIALQQGKLLKSKAALDTLWKAGAYNNGEPTQWAIGWMTKPRPKHRAVIATGGSRAAFFVYPEDDLAVVVLTNVAGAFPEEFIDELAGYYKPQIAASDPVTALRMKLRNRGYHAAVEVFNELKQKQPGFQPLGNGSKRLGLSHVERPWTAERSARDFQIECLSLSHQRKRLRQRRRGIRHQRRTRARYQELQTIARIGSEECERDAATEKT